MTCELSACLLAGYTAFWICSRAVTADPAKMVGMENARKLCCQKLEKAVVRSVAIVKCWVIQNCLYASVRR